MSELANDIRQTVLDEFTMRKKSVTEKQLELIVLEILQDKSAKKWAQYFIKHQTDYACEQYCSFVMPVCIQAIKNITGHSFTL